jgi:hypothetical protein
MCGARFDMPAPPQGYAPYPQQPYGMAPQRPPTKRMAVAGGVLSIVASATVIAIAAGALANDDVAREAAAKGFLFVAIVVAIVALVMAVLAIRGAWWGSLIAGIFQSIQLLVTLGCIGAIAEAKDKLRMEDWVNTVSGEGVDSDHIHALDALNGFFVMALLVVLVAMIFSYIGIGGAKRWARARASMQATSAFQ